MGEFPSPLGHTTVSGPLQRTFSRLSQDRGVDRVRHGHPETAEGRTDEEGRELELTPLSEGRSREEGQQLELSRLPEGRSVEEGQHLELVMREEGDGASAPSPAAMRWLA